MNGFRERSAQLGLSLLRGSTERGNEDAEYVYGRCLSEGIVVEADAGEAIGYLKVAAEQANSYALAQYGAALHAGRGVEQDRAKGIEFLERRRPGLARAYPGQGDGIDKDETRAAELFRLSAEQGDPNGQYSYAQVLEKGQSLPKDLVAAVQYYTKVIQQGYHNALLDCEQCERLLSTGP
jgi:TPR repeat protein